jgi:hypothetical protein
LSDVVPVDDPPELEQAVNKAAIATTPASAAERLLRTVLAFLVDGPWGTDPVRSV